MTINEWWDIGVIIYAYGMGVATQRIYTKTEDQDLLGAIALSCSWPAIAAYKVAYKGYDWVRCVYQTHIGELRKLRRQNKKLQEEVKRLTVDLLEEDK